MQRQLKVIGRGKVSLVPDMIIMILNLSKKELDYETALNQSSVQSRLVKEMLVELGFEEESIKTKRFHIEPEYTYRKENGTSKSVIDGFRFNNRLEFKFKIDNKLMGKILYKLSKLEVECKIEIQYSYSDMNSLNKILLESSVNDAIEKAKVLAKASNVELVQIQDIVHSFSDQNVSVTPFDRDLIEYCRLSTEREEYDIDINPSDITLMDIVTIVWEIR